jgi:hypothetical protein
MPTPRRRYEPDAPPERRQQSPNQHSHQRLTAATSSRYPIRAASPHPSPSPPHAAPKNSNPHHNHLRQSPQVHRRIMPKRVAWASVEESLLRSTARIAIAITGVRGMRHNRVSLIESSPGDVLGQPPRKRRLGAAVALAGCAIPWLVALSKADIYLVNPRTLGRKFICPSASEMWNPSLR